jgi:hypothetical protein
MKRNHQQCTNSVAHTEQRCEDREQQYLDATSGEGLGISWAYSGLHVEHCLKLCALCLEPECMDPQYHKVYSDDVWYLNLGTTTRYADVNGRTRSSKAVGGIVYKNVMCFKGQHTIVHLGTVDGSSEVYYAVFDRFHIHRVLHEMVTGRNSLRVEVTQRKSALKSPRCRWNENPSTGGSPLFHRWLLLDKAIESKYIVEHLNDIPLDCRERNLKLSQSLKDNNNPTHRLSRAFRNQDDGEEFETVRKKMKMERGEYHDLIRSTPRLPDCVFSKKRLRIVKGNSDNLRETSEPGEMHWPKSQSTFINTDVIDISPRVELSVESPDDSSKQKSFLEYLDDILQQPNSTMPEQRNDWYSL